MSEDEILAEPAVIYDHAERRLALCVHCPETGGDCRDDHTAITVGEKPTWEGRKLRMAPCPKFAEFRIRRRLEVSGVPGFYLDSTFGKLEREIDPGELEKLSAFGTGAERWLVVNGAHGSGKTRIGVALMRTLFRSVPTSLFWYSDVTTIRNVLRQRYDEPKSAPDPFENARIATVLIMDNVDPAYHQNEPWVNDRVEALLRQRWLNRRATLVLTHEPLEVLAQHFATIPELDKATVCNL